MLRKAMLIMGSTLVILSPAGLASGQFTASNQLITDTATSNEEATAFRVSPDGYVAIAGVTGSKVIAAVRNPSTGLVTKKTYTDPTGYECRPVAIAIGINSIFVACLRTSISAPTSIRLLKMAKDGSTNLSSPAGLDGTGTPRNPFQYSQKPTAPVDIVASTTAAGNEIVFVTGTYDATDTINGSPVTHKNIITYSASASAVVRWESPYGDSGSGGNRNDFPIGIAVGTDGYVFVGGSSAGYSTSTPDFGDAAYFTVLKYKPNYNATQLAFPGYEHGGGAYNKTGVTGFYAVGNTVYLCGTTIVPVVFPEQVRGYEAHVLSATAEPGASSFSVGEVVIDGRPLVDNNQDDTTAAIANVGGTTYAWAHFHGTLSGWPGPIMDDRYAVVIPGNLPTFYDEPVPFPYGERRPVLCGNSTKLMLTQKDSSTGKILTKSYMDGWSDQFDYGFGDNKFCGAGMTTSGTIYVGGYVMTSSGYYDMFIRQYTTP